MADHKEPFTDKVSFRVLSKLAKACFVIPVSNADPERIFFNVKKDTNWYEVRSEQWHYLLFNMCKIKPRQSDSVLRAAKKAVLTYQSNISSCN